MQRFPRTPLALFAMLAIAAPAASGQVLTVKKHTPHTPHTAHSTHASSTGGNHAIEFNARTIGTSVRVARSGPNEVVIVDSPNRRQRLRSRIVRNDIAAERVRDRNERFQPAPKLTARERLAISRANRLQQLRSRGVGGVGIVGPTQHIARPSGLIAKPSNNIAHGSAFRSSQRGFSRPGFSQRGSFRRAGRGTVVIRRR